MLGTRHLATLLVLLGALALALPAVTLAAGGGSAGDQQYTDPFGGSGTRTSSPAPSAPTSTSTPAPASPPSSSAASSGSSGSSASSGSGSDTGAGATTTPTATAAGTTTSSTAAGTATTLPYTGYDSWTAAVLGLVMLGGGIVLRRRSRRA